MKAPLVLIFVVVVVVVFDVVDVADDGSVRNVCIFLADLVLLIWH